MIWGTNYGRLLSQTLFTLFFAGRAFAPNCIIDGINIQDYLQQHYIAAFGELADRIKRADEEEGLELRDACVIGWDSLNEPAEGFVEWDDLNKYPKQQTTTIKKGTTPSPVQSFRLGMGQSQTVDTWDFGTFGPRRTGSVTINPKGRKIWAEPDPDATSTSGGELPDGTHPRWGWKRDVLKWPLGTCIWALHGVWDVQSGYILRPDYFKYNPSTGIEVHFLPDFWLPHFTAYTARIRQAHPDEIVFVQPSVFALPPHIGEEVLRGRCAYAGHYYDGLTLVTKHWNWFNADSLGVLRGKYKSPIQAVKFGERAIRKSIMEQIGLLKADAKLISAPVPPDDSLDSTLLAQSSPPNQYPIIIGEIGIPFDMDSKRSYFPSSHHRNKYRGDYTNQEKALDASLNACDGYNNVGYTIWTYIAIGGSVNGNEDRIATSHSHEWGDGWNGEDLSLWSADDLRRRWFDDDECHGPGNYDSSFNTILPRRMNLTRTSYCQQLQPQSQQQQESKNESRVGLLENHSSPNLKGGSNSVSMLTLNTSVAPRVPGTEESDSPILYTPSASTPTLLGFGPGAGREIFPRNKPSVALNVRTVAVGGGDDRDSPMLLTTSSPVHAGITDTNTTTTAVGQPTTTVDIESDKKDKSSPNTSFTLLGHNNSESVRVRRQEAERDPYNFLTDGARAVRAFCRPRALRVWGDVVDTKFEIGNAEFKCVVRVSDTASVPIDDHISVDVEDVEEDEEQATEIYLPIVHFASNELLENSKARWDPETAKQRLIQNKKKGIEGLDLMYPPTEMYGLETELDEHGSEPEQETTFLELIASNPNLLSVEVNVSSGKYKIKGQTLYWWYPHRGHRRRGEEREVTIEVKRRGGAIKVGRGGWVDVPHPRSRRQQWKKGEKRERREKSWCERLCECDFGCMVM